MGVSGYGASKTEVVSSVVPCLGLIRGFQELLRGIFDLPLRSFVNTWCLRCLIVSHVNMLLGQSASDGDSL